MKRSNAYVGDVLRTELFKKIKYDHPDYYLALLDTLIGDENNIRFILDGLRNYLKPTIEMGPDNSFFYFYVQDKKICIITNTQIYYHHKNRELLRFLFQISMKLYPLIPTIHLNDLPDPHNLVLHEYYLPNTLAMILGFRFV